MYLALAIARNEKIWIVAALLTAGMVPFTWIFMAGTNRRLLEPQGEEVRCEEVEALMRRWKDLNLVRAGFPLAGAVVGGLGVCGRWV